MVAGRSLTSFDGDRATPVVIVNETFANRFLSKSDAVGGIVVSTAGAIGPLGLNLMMPRPPHVPGTPPPASSVRYEIVGVVRDVRNAPLGQLVEPALIFRRDSSLSASNSSPFALATAPPPARRSAPVSRRPMPACRSASSARGENDLPRERRSRGFS
ncbi:MAG: hypothetical protein ABR606_06150 [Vicinamibacterales bacterium]